MHEASSAVEDINALTVLGLDTQVLAVYRALLIEPEATFAELSRLAGTSADQTKQALTVLTEQALVVLAQNAGTNLRAVSPQVGLNTLVAQVEAELTQRNHALQLARTGVLKFVEDYHASRAAHVTRSMEILGNRDEVLNRLGELHQEVSREVLSMVTNRPTLVALNQARQGDDALLARGITVRVLCLDSFRRDRDVLDYLRESSARGAHVRTRPTLPVRLIIHDRSLAVVAADPDDVASGAIIVRSRGIVRALVELFEQTWRDSVDVFAASDSQEPELTATEVAVLRLMASGAKDATIARNLNVSLRTTRRLIADVTAKLGASSRFELGVEVGRGRLV